MCRLISYRIGVVPINANTWCLLFENQLQMTKTRVITVITKPISLKFNKEFQVNNLIKLDHAKLFKCYSTGLISGIQNKR
jgi:hypothetical protein